MDIQVKAESVRIWIRSAELKWPEICYLILGKMEVICFMVVNLSELEYQLGPVKNPLDLPWIPPE